MLLTLAILTSALLFGGMTLYAFGFAAALFTTLPGEMAGATLRRVFPWFYVFVMVTAGLAAALLWAHEPRAAGLLALVALTTWPTRQWLMPAINRATDTGHRQRFKQLHGLSVVITIVHIAVAGYVLVSLVRPVG